MTYGLGIVPSPPQFSIHDSSVGYIASNLKAALHRNVVQFAQPPINVSDTYLDVSSCALFAVRVLLPVMLPLPHPLLILQFVQIDFSLLAAY